MDNQINLKEITDINQLKAWKSDNYDLIEQAKAQIEVSTRNINALNVRLAELDKVEEKVEIEPVE